MVKFIKRLFGQSEEPEDPNWLEQFCKIKRQTDEIIGGLDSAIINTSLETELAALKKASMEMLGPLQEIKALRLMIMRGLQKQRF